MIAIVTDSTCDLPASVAAEANVHVVPAHITVGQENLGEDIGINPSDFYRQLSTYRTPPKTSSSAPGAFADLYSRLLSSASHVISIHIASQFSGIYSAAAVTR